MPFKKNGRQGWVLGTTAAMLSHLSHFRRGGLFGVRHVSYAPDERRIRFMAGVNTLFRYIEDDGDITAQMEAQWVDARSWKYYLNTFRRRLISQPLEVLGSDAAVTEFTESLDKASTSLGHVQNPGPLKKYVLDIVQPAALHDMREKAAAAKMLASSADLRMPHEWYPYARLMRRKIVYHGGPTNSGKVEL
jgi:hypothetical protein